MFIYCVIFKLLQLDTFVAFSEGAVNKSLWTIFFVDDDVVDVGHYITIKDSK